MARLHEKLLKLREVDAEMQAALLSFFKDNQNPKDSELHAWAEKKGFDVHEVETQIYKLATKYANFFNDGKANKKGFEEKDADPKELKMGIEVEKEHTPDADVAKRIALDHLAELKDYYTRLKKMEKSAGTESMMDLTVF
jgi:hypothetical protein